MSDEQRHQPAGRILPTDGRTGQHPPAAQVEHAEHGPHAQPELHAQHGLHAHHGANAHGVHPAHQRPEAQDGHDAPHADGSWRTAVSATLHCLTGCAIGEVLGMVLGTWWGWGDLPTILLAVALAFLFGYALTITPVLRAGLTLRRAIPVALAADTVSIATMEVIDNAIMLTVPGAMEAGLSTALFWAALAFSLVVAFVVTVPVNRALISRGRGHAVVHGYHH